VTEEMKRLLQILHRLLRHRPMTIRLQYGYLGAACGNPERRLFLIHSWGDDMCLPRWLEGFLHRLHVASC